MRTKIVASSRVYNFEKSLLASGRMLGRYCKCNRRRKNAQGFCTHCMLPFLLPRHVSISLKGQRATAGNEPRVQEGEEIVPSTSYWKTKLTKNARLGPKLGRRLQVLTWWGECKNQPCRVQYT